MEPPLPGEVHVQARRPAKGETLHTIGENQYLAKNASSLRYEGTIVVGEDQWSYDETTMLQMYEMTDPFAHTDHNTMRRTG